MADQLALLGIIATVVLGLGAIAATIYVFRKQSPRREFSYDLRATPLVSGAVRGSDRLTLAYDGSPVTNPYLVTLQLASSGRADITSSSFDGDKPILFELNVPILAEIEQTPSTSTVSAQLQYNGEGSVIQLPPSLLPKGFGIRASYVCDGEPTLEPKIELADITIRDGIRSFGEKNKLWLNAAVFAIGVAAAGLGALLAESIIFKGLTP
ncbi:hypothetical protein [Arthrobacter sp. 9AX]|uniref:hypothetical protein n=1 Tax=Arthrobacter sp. 9AX TaxID=2653131 RepID=UPI001358D195|nr:hypothetical protein [Arthrobacter sp. 9AX]